MVENIALIKEFHEHMATSQAQNLAKEYLQTLELAHIGSYRVNQCSSLELFYVMVVRALMSHKKDIFILTPLLLIKDIDSMNAIIETLEKLNDGKKRITIVDTFSNKLYYEGCRCNIIE
jgi:ABC-type lipoprotein export system ATPase subunit